MAKLTTEEFIAKAKAVHGDKYDYSKVEYVDSTTKACIGCKKHGDFWQKPNIHLQGKGCFKCGREKIATSSRKSLEQFLQDAKRIHGDRYNYAKEELKHFELTKSIKQEDCRFCIDFVVDCALKLQEFDFNIGKFIKGHQII